MGRKQVTEGKVSDKAPQNMGAPGSPRFGEGGAGPSWAARDQEICKSGYEWRAFGVHSWETGHKMEIPVYAIWKTTKRDKVSFKLERLLNTRWNGAFSSQLGWPGSDESR